MFKCMLAAAFGLALMVAPGALDYDDPAASLHYTIGPLIVSFSVIAIWEPVRGARFINLPLALTVILITPVLSLDVVPVAVALAAGTGSAVLSLLPNEVKGKYGGGWRELMRREA